MRAELGGHAARLDDPDPDVTFGDRLAQDSVKPSTPNLVRL
jgi:hypothetical protein